MIEFLAFIVLVAIFFGVSLSTALYGTINAMLIIFLISFVFVLLTPSAKKFWEWFTAVEPQKPQTPAAKKSTKKRKVNAKSLLGVLSLGIMKGSSINSIASGSDEEEAVNALVALVESDFVE
jgi:hypothetical protein